MENELFDILNEFMLLSQYEYSKDDISLLTEKVIYTISKYKNNRYLKKFKIYPDLQSEDRMASYIYRYKLIEFYLKTFLEYINHRTEHSDFDARQKAIFTFAELLVLILHEMEHASHYAKLESILDQSLEKKLLASTDVHKKDVFIATIKDILKRNLIDNTLDEFKRRISFYKNVWNVVYDEFYEYILSERLADIVAYSTAKKVFSKSDEYELQFLLLSLKQQETCIETYKLQDMGASGKIVLSPTIRIMEILSNINLSKKIPFDWYSPDVNECLENVTSCLGFHTRYKYGLPITVEEYEEQISKLSKTEKVLEKKYGLHVITVDRKSTE